MNNGSCEFESHLGHQKVVGATALATFSFYPAMPIPKVGVEGEVDTMTDPLRGSCCCVHCYHQAARPCTQGHLHGVSHDAASPMPVASNFGVVGICGIFLIDIWPTKLSLNY